MPGRSPMAAFVKPIFADCAPGLRRFRRRSVRAGWPRPAAQRQRNDRRYARRGTSGTGVQSRSGNRTKPARWYSRWAASIHGVVCNMSALRVARRARSTQAAPRPLPAPAPTAAPPASAIRPRPLPRARPRAKRGPGRTWRSPGARAGPAPPAPRPPATCARRRPARRRSPPWRARPGVPRRRPRPARRRRRARGGGPDAPRSSREVPQRRTVPGAPGAVDVLWLRGVRRREPRGGKRLGPRRASTRRRPFDQHRGGGGRHEDPGAVVA